MASDRHYNDRLLLSAQLSCQCLCVLLLLQTSLLGELRELGSAISRDIYLDSPNVHWGDIAGLDEAKRQVNKQIQSRRLDHIGIKAFGVMSTVFGTGHHHSAAMMLSLEHRQLAADD